jgi:MipA family protein
MYLRRKARAWAVTLWAVATLAAAQTPTDAPSGGVADSAAASNTAIAVAAPPGGTSPGSARERPWRLGLALGYGKRTNPLIQSEDLPVIVDVDIAWFGKRWFFDNGDLGVSLLDRPRFTTNLVARVNSDRVFFGKTNTEYLTFSYRGNGTTGPLLSATGALAEAPVAVKPPKRDYAIETGIETLFDGVWGAASVRAFHDVSGTHRGYEVAADYRYRMTHGRLSLAPTLGLSYKSARLNDYYWGVHEDEANAGLPVYEVGGGLSWEAGLRANYYVTKRLRFALSLNYERLHDAVAASPLAREDHVLAYFSGLAWMF